MRIEITSKNFKPKDTLKELLEKKISKFDKYFRKEASAKVRLSTIGNGKYQMEITIVADGALVRSENASDNMYDNIDIILPKIERQIAKYRKKLDVKVPKEDLASSLIYDTNIGAFEEMDKPAKVVKTKRFELALMDVDNAIAEMELLEHNFYIFINSENEKVSVLYKRNDGDYGLIIPEY